MHARCLTCRLQCLFPLAPRCSLDTATGRPRRQINDERTHQLEQGSQVTDWRCVPGKQRLSTRGAFLSQQWETNDVSRQMWRTHPRRGQAPRSAAPHWRDPEPDQTLQQQQQQANDHKLKHVKQKRQKCSMLTRIASLRCRILRQQRDGHWIKTSIVNEDAKLFRSRRLTKLSNVGIDRLPH
jgi:hypothetical protein